MKFKKLSEKKLEVEIEKNEDYVVIFESSRNQNQNQNQITIGYTVVASEGRIRKNKDEVTRNNPYLWLYVASTIDAMLITNTITDFEKRFLMDILHKHNLIKTIEIKPTYQGG